jgi:hypothetical protein
VWDGQKKVGLDRQATCPGCFNGAVLMKGKEVEMENPTSIATGFDFEPLPDGNVLIEFFGDDGRTFNKQVVTADVLGRIPLVAILTDIAIKQGPDVAKEIMEKLKVGDGGRFPQGLREFFLVC